MSQSPIDRLCRDLQQEFRSDPRGVRAAALLARYAEHERDWRDWTFFETSGYTRNLVHRTDAYELLLLCWGAGQESPIHDHSGQHCWMAVLDGSIEELHYRERAGRAPEEGNVRRFEPGQVAYIVDDIALHLVRAARGAPGVSLHLYAQPIDSCRIYDPVTGAASAIDAGYHSVRGELCGDKPPAAVRAEWR